MTTLSAPAGVIVPAVDDHVGVDVAGDRPHDARHGREPGAAGGEVAALARDDLAADSLDLVDLAVTLETRFGIVWPERAFDRVRSYGDLVRATRAMTA